MFADKILRMRQWPAIAVLAAMTALAGCETAGPYVAYDTRVLDEVQDELLKSRDAAGKSNRIEPPAAVLAALLPPITLLTEEASALEARFDFTVKEALPIRDFVNLLTVGTDLSVVVHPDTKGTISALDLKNVTVTDVLDQVSDLYGYSIVIENAVYQIRPGGLQTRIFRLNYLNVSRSGNSSMQVTASGISEGGNQNGNQSKPKPKLTKAVTLTIRVMAEQSRTIRIIRMPGGPRSAPKPPPIIGKGLRPSFGALSMRPLRWLDKPWVTSRARSLCRRRPG